MNRIKQFDFSTFSFQGHTLIEASAGTGKTYIIAMLYLRLILGIHNQCLPALTIEKILLVTFTKVATEELRARIHNNIREFRLACLVGHSQNVFFSELLNKIYDIHLVYRRLLEAERNIGLAQIFTIHGFCQRVLDMCPVELNASFHYKILANEELLFKKACNDFWRRYFYPLPIEVTSIIEGYWSQPENLLKEIYPYLHNVAINIHPIFCETDIVKQHINIIGYINDVKNMWNIKKTELLNVIDNLSLNRRIYNVKNIKNWCKKIDCWANTKTTQNYKVPNVLKRFRYSSIVNDTNIQKFQIFGCPLFKEIEKLFSIIMSLKQLIFNLAIKEIRKIVQDMKNISSEISFNDLIYLLDDTLSHPDKGKQIAQLICKYYPVAIIDEFQDTDFYQYRIFHTLYALCPSKYGLLLIGDPKQSIYSFRGADIFSYLLARKNVDFHYTLNINWRSSAGMINAINTLFQINSSSPFIFQNIPFIPMNVANKNKNLHLVVYDKLYPALHFWLPSCTKITLYEYQKVIAYQCAYTILNLLHGARCNCVWLQNGNNKRLLQESDIVILVRDRNEGSLISSILKEFNIGTIYLSNSQENIFYTNEANDLLLILQAVLSPENNNLLRCALMTNLIGYNAKMIDFINQDEATWKKEVEEFTNYYFNWKKYGIQSMLQDVIFRRNIVKNMSCDQERERSLTNILHLTELLQKKSIELNNEGALIYWLHIQIHGHGNVHSDDKLLRPQQCDYPLIKVITIHKAKGLEFPLVFLPFVPTLHVKKYPLFHDRKNYQMYLDLNNALENQILSEEERLSEDLRLLYVAVTRAIYHCFIGIGAISFKKNSSMMKDYSDLHRTALGYLVQNGIPGNFEFLENCLKKLVQQSNGDIAFNIIVDNQYNESLINKLKIFNNNDIFNQELPSARQWKMSIDTIHKITSYTELSRYSTLSSSMSSTNLKFLNIENLEENNKFKERRYTSDLFTPHTFPKGNVAGNFLHYIFQKWDFQKRISDEWLMIALEQSGIELVWLPVIQRWMNVVVNTPLDNKDLMLSKLSFENRRPELQFYLSIDNIVSAEEFNMICKEYDPISRLSSNLKFPSFLGMLHGFIDLVFFWQGKYYVADYKSNWLGDTYNSYILSAMQHEMIVQSYALQYQIYVLALHRFLRHKLVQYNYENNFGGVYYLFLRGIDSAYPGRGIYFCRPKQLLIDKLDKLLSISRMKYN